MGLAEKALLASLKAQRARVAAQAGNPGLDDETRALVQENLTYLQAQIDALQGGGKVADLAGISEPASWDTEDSAMPMAVGVAGTSLVAGFGDAPPAAEATPAPKGGWGRKAILAAIVIGVVVIGVAVIGVVWAVSGGLAESGCDIWTLDGGWQHYEADHPACDD